MSADPVVEFGPRPRDWPPPREGAQRMACVRAADGFRTWHAVADGLELTDDNRTKLIALHNEVRERHGYRGNGGR